MKALKAVLVLLLVLLCFVNVQAQTTDSNAQKPPAKPQSPVNPVAKPPAKPKPPANPNSPSTPPPKPPKKLLGVQDLPVFCVENFKPPHRKMDAACSKEEFESRTGNAKALADALSDDDFLLKVLGDDKIVVYCANAKGCEKRIDTLRGQMLQLAEPAVTFKKTLTVPKGLASRIAGQVSSLNGAGITAEALGDSTILLKSQRTPSEKEFAELKERIGQTGWDRDSASPALRLFELDAATVAKQLAPPAGGAGKDSGGSSGDGGSKDKSGDKGTAPPTPG